MRVLLASHLRNNPDAGASRVYHLLDEGLRARGHSVKTLHYEDMGLPRHRERLASRLLLPWELSRRVARENLGEYDVVMSSSGMLYPLFKRLRPNRVRPLLVSHLHGSSFFDHQARLNETMRGHMSLSWVYKNVTGPLPVHWDECGSLYADLTIVQNALEFDLRQERGTGPVVSIPLLVHPEIAQAASTAVPAEQRNPHALLWFGSWLEKKGCHYLPRAFGMIADRFPEATLSIWGAGVPAGTLLERFDPSLRSRISVVPKISRPEQIANYGRHSIVLFPSLSEGFGLALLEAMSMGLAAVTTYTGFGADALRDRENAIVVPSASALHLARGAMDLMENDELRCRVAEAGQAVARTFTLERFIDAYEDAFEAHRGLV